MLIQSTFQRGYNPKYAVQRATVATTNAMILNATEMEANNPTRIASIATTNLGS